MEKPTVILIHGATLNGPSWNPVRRHLDPRLRVVAPDLPGHGKRQGERFTLQGAVETVVRAAHELGGAPFVLAGDSLGSYTAQAAAAALPQDRLKGLVLGGASHEFIGRPVYPYMAKAMMFRVLLPLLGERRVVEHRIPRVLRIDFGLSEEDIAATMQGGVSLKVFPQAVAALHGVDFRARLARISQPTMFINGERDTFHVRGEAKYVAAAQQATVHRFDCDHGVSLHRSAGYAELLNDPAHASG